MNASEPREDAVAVLQRLLASHKDYTQSQQRGWPAHDKGYPNLEWSLEIEHSAEAAIAALAQQGAEPVAWQPIETAPKDGTTEYLFFHAKWGEMSIGIRPLDCPDDAAADLMGTAYYPTHWQPLPPPPEPATQEVG